MHEDKSFIRASGTILSRKLMGENNLSVTLFLKQTGILNASVPSGQSGKNHFGGDTEPLAWGIFSLRKKRRSKNFFIEDIEINDDMLNLRRSRLTLTTALNWSKILVKYLLPDQPDDELLANLYWSMKLLTCPNVPTDAAEWRFIWKWLENWGLAPDIVNFHVAMKFNTDEILLLTQLANRTIKGVTDFFANPINYNIRENMFKVATKLAVKFLNET